MGRVVFPRAKIVHVMEGRAYVETARGARELDAGSALSIGANIWCSLRPDPSVRIWTLYIDEEFLRAQLALLLPDRSRLASNVESVDWDGSPLVVEHGVDALRRLEPLWRQISILDNVRISPELAATRTLALFVRSIELSLPALLAADTIAGDTTSASQSPVVGNLVSPTSIGIVGRATRMLRVRLAEPWTVNRLAAELALSRSQLTRLFTTQVGASPMRFLTEIRLTEFTRLVEETDLPLPVAAKKVGWADSRVAATWFRRRYGISPSRFRGTPHPSLHDGHF
jgi:AraC family transcriptional regulator